MSKREKLPPLEEGLLAALQAIDNQVAREVGTRSPTDRDEHGVQKWEPLVSRVERICGFVLDKFGENEIDLDGIVVLSQAMTKTLQLLFEELGEEGLGKVRHKYCAAALEEIEKSVTRGLRSSGTALN